MIAVKKMIEELEKYPKDAQVYAYEGEITGLVIVDSKTAWLGEILAREGKEE
jgi:hypothetical protein